MAKKPGKSGGRARKASRPKRGATAGKPAAARTARHAMKALAAPDDHSHVDGCDIDFTKSEATPDSALPPAKGGVEILRTTRRR